MQTEDERPARSTWEGERQSLLDEVDRLLQKRLAEAVQGIQTRQTQRAMAAARQTGAKMEDVAAKALANGRSTSTTKTLAASILAQSKAQARHAGGESVLKEVAVRVAERLKVSLSQVTQLPVKAARDDLSGLIARVVERNEVVIVRDARRSAAEGVVIMSEARALDEPARGGLNLAELVASFATSPVQVRSLTVPESADDDEPLSFGRAAAPAG